MAAAHMQRSSCSCVHLGPGQDQLLLYFCPLQVVWE